MPRFHKHSWVHKYLFLCFSDKLSDFHVERYQWFHLLTLGINLLDPDGRYVFNGLTPGNYTVDAVLEENLFFTTTEPIITVSIDPVQPDPTLSPSPINVTLGQSLTDIDLGVNVQGVEPDTVSGIVFNDLNGNGLYEPLKGETGLPGVEVYLAS